MQKFLSNSADWNSVEKKVESAEIGWNFWGVFVTQGSVFVLKITVQCVKIIFANEVILPVTIL